MFDTALFIMAKIWKKPKCLLMEKQIKNCSIYKMEYALILAITIAIIDALPILGTGTVLIPWGIFNFVMGNYQLGIFLILLYYL